MKKLLVLLLIIPVFLLSQGTGKITGKVINDEGMPLAAVNVIVEGTSMGAATDEDGYYIIEKVPPGAYTIKVNMIGYAVQVLAVDIEAGESLESDFTMEKSYLKGEEVVVIGYGTQQRREVTGSVTRIDDEVLKDLPMVSFESAIQGQISGVEVQEPSGEPGSAPNIRVRGTGSITAGNEPLYVVDGLPIGKNTAIQGGVFQQRTSFQPPSSNPLAILNPDDIESIEILKDASAAAIYGSRGANGVVIITTRRAKENQEPVVRLNAYTGFSEVFNVPDMMNAEEIIEYTKDSRNNNYIQKYDPLNPESANYNPDYDPTTNTGRPADDFVLIPDKYVNWDGTDTDWLGLIFQNGPINNTNISVTGSGDGVGYYLSGGYFDQMGIIDGSAYERYTLSGRIVSDISDKLRVGLNFNTLQSTHDRVPANAPYFGSPPGIVYSAMVHSPVINPYNEDGSINQLDNQSYLGGGTTSASNPLAIIEGVDEEINSQRTFGNVYADYQITDKLSYRSMFGVDRTSYARAYYRANSLFYRTATEGEPFGQSSNGRAVNWLWENTMNYNTSIGAHNIGVLAGYTAQKEVDDLTTVVAQNFPDDEVTTLSGGQVTDGTSLREEWSLVSMLARLNYNYDYKYLLSAAVRSDRSSRFGKNNQTGVFPSVSAAWRLSEESFLKAIDLISELKLRTSYGVTGNFLIPNYGSIGLLEQGLYPIGTNADPAVYPSTLSNSDLGWETTKQVNAGIDFGFAGDRVYGSVDVYNSNTENLLLEVSIPSATGFTTALTNIGKVNNKGVELNITSRNIVSSFNWSTDFNISKNVNEVIALGPGDEPILSSGAAGIRHITRVGDPIGSYYGHVVVGIYQNAGDIANAPVDELAPNPQPGDFMFKDINNDGVINNDDRTVLGSYQPDYTWGITNRVKAGAFDASIFLQGVEGREILNLTARHMKNGEANFNSYDILNERWISEDEPGNGEIPRADRQTDLHGNNNRPSSYQVEDGSYVRIKNLTVGYTMNPHLVQRFASTLRLYASVSNLAIWTDYLGFNPEVSLQSQNMLVQGEDYGAYPLSRTYSMGVNITF